MRATQAPLPALIQSSLVTPSALLLVSEDSSLGDGVPVVLALVLLRADPALKPTTPGGVTQPTLQEWPCAHMGRVRARPEGTASQQHLSVFLWCHAFDMEPVTRNPWVCAHQELPVKEGDLMDPTPGGSQATRECTA